MPDFAMYVTDTHSLLWFLTGDERLGSKARKIFRSCDNGETTVVIPSIVLLECLYVCERKKVELKFREIVEGLNGNYHNYPTYPLDAEVVLNCEDMRGIAELHDRVIASTARMLNAKVITKDEKMRDSKLVETVW